MFTVCASKPGVLKSKSVHTPIHLLTKSRTAYTSNFLNLARVLSLALREKEDEIQMCSSAIQNGPGGLDVCRAVPRQIQSERSGTADLLQRALPPHYFTSPSSASLKTRMNLPQCRLHATLCNLLQLQLSPAVCIAGSRVDAPEGLDGQPSA